MRHVGAADVERPGHRLRIRNNESIRAQLAHFRADSIELGLGGFAGEALVMQRDRPEWRWRAIAPDCVDQVGLDCNQGGAGSGAGFAQSLRVFDRVQPWVVADAVTAAEIVLDPEIGRCCDEVLEGKQRGIHLLARLERVAAIDEEDGPLHEDDRRAGAAGKAREPGQPLLAIRKIFVLVAIGARHDQAGQAATCQFGTQRREPEPACGAFGSVLERLEACLEHDCNLWGGRCSGNARARSKNSGLAIGAQAWTSWR